MATTKKQQAAKKGCNICSVSVKRSNFCLDCLSKSFVGFIFDLKWRRLKSNRRLKKAATSVTFQLNALIFVLIDYQNPSLAAKKGCNICSVSVKCSNFCLDCLSKSFAGFIFNLKWRRLKSNSFFLSLFNFLVSPAAKKGCNICCVSVKPSGLKKHMKKHKNVFECAYCDNGFKNLEQLNLHIKMDHRLCSINLGKSNVPDAVRILADFCACLGTLMATYMDIAQIVPVKLDDTNYVHWVSIMYTFLKGQNLRKYVTGERQEPKRKEFQTRKNISKNISIQHTSSYLSSKNLCGMSRRGSA
ncbi:hypothetical protein H6P81_001376 [Aristolochia fimbriata]|uniref:C2H2-type domain-containing protein n=1 Tax=Aristolochia fimbriata TaxID=158543 RepID=A0AAV7F7B5_ARIFI|nr:hypothetical protein H6P81_001376 [Aristolochia fimbriata]